MKIIDNIFKSMNFIGKENISLSKALLFFYLFIASNFTKGLYAGQLKEFIEQSRIAQHLIGLITMLIIIINIGNIRKPKKAILYATVAYILFTLSTKLDIQWNLAIIVLLTIGYMYEAKMLDKEIESDTDQALDLSDKEKIKNKNDKIKSLIVVSIVAVIIVGIIQYMNKKQVQYGDEFDGLKFMFNGRNKIYKLVK